MEYTNIHYVSGAAHRLDRIYRSILSRLHSSSINLTDLNFALKQMLSLMRLMYEYKYYEPDTYTNHGLIYYNRQILYALPFLRNFKEFDKWELKVDERIQQTLDDHILSDGMHDEHAFSYGFYVCHALGEVADFKERNTDPLNYNIFNSSLIAHPIRNKMEEMYKYFIHVVKPNQSYIDLSTGYYSTDIPIIGDSFAPIQNPGGWLGKVFLENPSILTYPIIRDLAKPYPYGDFFIDPNSSLGQKLYFVANGNGGMIPTETSKFFNEGKSFISRSNWAVQGSSNLDYNARYCLFRCNPFTPETTHPGHHHADLLSLEFSGYNNNYLIDPGGYSVKSGISETNFQNLYSRASGYTHMEDLCRHYFIGTAAHNTVYIAKSDQLQPYGPPKYLSNWIGIENLHYDNFESIIDDEFDFASAGYYKTEGKNERHNRKLLYIKGENDYWLVSDIVRLNNGNGIERTEQIWHLAPPQNGNGSIEFASNGIVKSHDTNFWIIPIIDESNRIIVDGFNAPLPEALIPSKIIKYRREKQHSETFSYLTIIFPYSSSNELTGATIEKIDIYEAPNKSSTFLVDDSEAQAYHLYFTIEGINYSDYCFISHSSFGTYYWDYNNNGQLESINSKMRFLRFDNQNILIKNLNLNYPILRKDLTIENDLITLPNEYKLGQNYPNPFNPSTTIKYSLKDESDVKLVVYDLLGREIRTLVNNRQTSGYKSVVWDGHNNSGAKVSSGIYIYKIIAGNFVQTRKMIFMK